LFVAVKQLKYRFRWFINIFMGSDQDFTFNTIKKFRSKTSIFLLGPIPDFNSLEKHQTNRLVEGVFHLRR
jgi:hypothetical protein